MAICTTFIKHLGLSPTVYAEQLYYILLHKIIMKQIGLSRECCHELLAHKFSIRNKLF